MANHLADTLVKIDTSIANFSAQCEEAGSTDTGMLWDILSDYRYWIEKAMSNSGIPFTPAVGETSDDDDSDDA